MNVTEQSAGKDSCTVLIPDWIKLYGAYRMCTVQDIGDASEPSRDMKQCEWKDIYRACRFDTAGGRRSENCRAIVGRDIEIILQHLVAAKSFKLQYPRWSLVASAARLDESEAAAVLANPEVCLHRRKALGCL